MGPITAHAHCIPAVHPEDMHHLQRPSFDDGTNQPHKASITTAESLLVAAFDEDVDFISRERNTCEL